MSGMESLIAARPTTPTKRQYERLLQLAGGSAGLSAKKRDTEPLLRRGWVTAKWIEPFYQWVRITPDGLRALALGVEKFGLPDLGVKPQTIERVCADCGSGRYRFVSKAVPKESIAA